MPLHHCFPRATHRIRSNGLALPGAGPTGVIGVTPSATGPALLATSLTRATGALPAVTGTARLALGPVSTATGISTW